jgi:hypothetical protein
MNTTLLEELKKSWDEDNRRVADKTAYDRATLHKIVRSRVNTHMRSAFRYFWGAFVLQIIVYAMLCHVIVRYWGDQLIFLTGIAGLFLYLPFTVMLMKKFKALAVIRPGGHTGDSLYEYVFRHRSLLLGFYRFKVRYELLLVPISSVIGIYLTFRIFVPGGVAAYPMGALIALAITLLSCAWAMASENKKNFKTPLRRLEEMLSEFKREG